MIFGSFDYDYTHPFFDPKSNQGLVDSYGSFEFLNAL